MSDWPLLRNNLAVEDDAALASYGVTVTASGSSNTKGSYTQLVAALSRTAIGILLQFRGNSAAYTLFDIAIGGAGSEQVVVPNLPGSVSLASNGDTCVSIPIYIPAGSRVSARMQAGVGGNTLVMKAHFITDNFCGMQAPQRWVNWGADLATSHGTAVVSSGSVNTKGSWVQLVAASEITTKWLIVAPQITGTARNFAVDIGVGGAGSEQVILSNLKYVNASLGILIGPFPFSIPAGSRVAVRAASDIATSTTFLEVLGGG